MTHPANLWHPLGAQLDYARKSGDRAAYADVLTSMADLRIYEAAYLGIPDRYVDPSSGTWTVPETDCRACWKPIDGPVMTLPV